MDQTVAQAFKLRAYQDVIVNIVDPKVCIMSMMLQLFLSLEQNLCMFFFFTGGDIGPGGTDIQGPVHRQRRHVEAEEEPGEP